MEGLGADRSTGNYLRVILLLLGLALLPPAPLPPGLRFLPHQYSSFILSPFLILSHPSGFLILPHPSLSALILRDPSSIPCSPLAAEAAQRYPKRPLTAGLFCSLGQLVRSSPPHPTQDISSTQAQLHRRWRTEGPPLGTSALRATPHSASI